MKFSICFLAIILAFTGSSSALTLRQIEGTWDVTSSWRGGGSKGTDETTVVIKELGKGRFRVVTTEKGKSRVSTREWFNPGGTSRLVSYDDKGRIETTGKGKWRIRGSRMHYNYKLSSKRASVDWVGTATRVNSNRLETSATMSYGALSYRTKSVFIRRR